MKVLWFALLKWWLSGPANVLLCSVHFTEFDQERTFWEAQISISNFQEFQFVCTYSIYTICLGGTNISVYFAINLFINSIFDKVREKSPLRTIARNWKGIHITSALKTQMKKKKGLSWWSINKFLILGDPIIIINMIIMGDPIRAATGPSIPITSSCVKGNEGWWGARWLIA